MKKFKLVACAAAAAAMFATNAFAAADMDSANENTNAGVYAKEAVIAPAGTTLAAGAAADQAATVALGATLAVDAVAYVRFDLPAGVTFVGAPTFAITDSNNTATTPSIAQGGAGQSFVIFAVAPSAAGRFLLGTRVGTMTANGISVKNNSAVSLTYKLFETLTNAANSNLPLKTATEASFLSFANAITFDTTTAQTVVADVSADTGAYTKFTGNSTEKAVAALNVTYTQRAQLSGAATVNAGTILAGTNAVTVSGDFTAATVTNNVVDGVTLKQNSCAGAEIGTVAVAADKLSATFTGISAANITGPLVVCYAVNETNAIVAGSYSGTVDLVANSGYTVADGATGTGSITRNGTVLKAAFGEVPAGSFSGTVNLTNTGSNVANFTTSCVTTTGRVAGRAGSVAANSASRFGIASASGLACPANTRGLELTFAVPTGNVIGSVVRQDATTGQASFDGMVGNQ